METTETKIDYLLSRWLGVVGYMQKRFMDAWLDQTESPIERIMGSALYLSELVGGFRMMPLDTDGTPRPYGYGAFWENITIRPQAGLEGWRVDFLVNAPGITVIVECDGFDFHERTPDQAARDRARDREYQKLGYVVFRFTGREIFRDAADCASQVAKIINDRGQWADFRAYEVPKREP